MAKKRFSIKGKQLLTLGLAALVITAGYYRWTVEEEKYESVSVTSEAIPTNGEEEQKKEEANQNQEMSLSALKEERDRTRGEMKEQWEKTAKSNDAGIESKQEAEKKIKMMNEYIEKENTIEMLVKAKGYGDCFAHINESGVTVRVSGGEINGSKVAQIKDIIVGETDVPVRNIKISAE